MAKRDTSSAGAKLIQSLNSIIDNRIADHDKRIQAMLTYEAERTSSMIFNSQVGRIGPLRFIEARPQRAPLSMESFPQNFEELLNLSVTRCDECLDSYDIDIAADASVAIKRRAVGKYIGVMIP